MERGRRASYRHGTGMNLAGGKWNLRGEISGGASVTGVKFGRRRKTMTWPGRWGPRINEREREIGTGSGFF
jgi:hypothetical protein